jgi:peptide/nickel transport system permease protein
MRRYLARRLGLSAITLALVSILVFSAATLLPGNIAATVLGNRAPPSEIAAFNKSHGFDRPVLTQYWSWLTGFIRGNWGTSLSLGEKVRPLVFDRLLHSLDLALFALVIIAPISVGLGVLAALRNGTWVDRLISVTGLSMTAFPEFVSGSILAVILGIELKWLPVASRVPTWSPVSIVHNLLLPSIPLMFVLFGYIARMARTGTIDALNSNYARTAYLKGLPRSTVLFKHVLRNSMLPTVTVIATQIGYLVGGLVVTEDLFQYPGIGQLLYKAALVHDQPLLEATVFLIAIIYTATGLIADLAVAALNPRVRLVSV